MTPSAQRSVPGLREAPAGDVRRASCSFRRRALVLLLLIVALGWPSPVWQATAVTPAAAAIDSGAPRTLDAVLQLSVPMELPFSPSVAWSSSPTDSSSPRWTWPVSGTRTVVAPFRAPAHAFGAGHRGIDILADAGGPVVAPADGVVAFRGRVVDRPLLTIEHADGFVSTLEPVESSLLPGDEVRTGQAVGTLVEGGGHTPVGALHLGVRRDGAYIDPMLLFGGARRAVLLPCCAPL